MKIIFILISLGITFLGCKGRNIKYNIIQQGCFISDENDRINTYYVYDFISQENIKYHASQSKYSLGRTTVNFYFSHNGNIPSQEIKFAKTLSEAYEIINDYSYYIKYVYEKNSSGEIKLVDCSQIPKDDLCTPD